MLKHRNFLHKWHAKNAEAKPHRNPLFPDRDFPNRRKMLLTIITAIAVMMGAVAFIIYGPLFQIKGVVINGLSSITEDQIAAIVVSQRQKRTWFIFPQSNKLLFDEESLATELKQRFLFKVADPSFDGKTLVIHVEESVLEVALRHGEKTYFLALDGSISREASAEESLVLDIRLGKATTDEGVILPSLQPSMPIVVLGQSGGEEALKLDERVIQGIVTTDEGLRGLGLTPTVHEVVRLTDRWITTKTTDNFDIMIDVTKDIDAQLTMLKTVLDNRNGAAYEYIDVRFGEHVFVKEL